MWTIDFETEAIVSGSNKMPKPVGLAIKPPEGESYYMAFGHPTNNNCTEEDAEQELGRIWHEELCGHNILAFDIEVARQHWGLPARDPLLTHDTLFMAYLIDANAPELKLKWLAENWLGMPPDDQEALQHWILANVPECRTLKQTGAYICRAPGDMVGRYAVSDVEMTKALFDYCWPKIAEMLEPYDRERTLAPILADIQHRGIRIDQEKLDQSYKQAMEKLHELDSMVRTALNAPNLNPGSDRELVTALQGAGMKGFLTTPTGKLSANKKSLEAVLEGAPELRGMLRSRALYSTLTGTFMGPWLSLCASNGGSINPSYNQVRNPEGYGTRTGRLSSSHPNGQNIPTDQGMDFYGDHFPEMRAFCLPDPGHVWYSIDFKAQEPRVAAHFEDGLLMQAFQATPDLDPYIFVMDTVGGDVVRKEAKVIFLGLLYTMGAAALAERLECSQERATALRNTIRASLPDIVALDRSCKRRFELGMPIRTMGGRYVNCEPPSNGRVWAYKALNLLVQGSSADQTKEAVIYAAENLPKECRLLGTVHDEINLSGPADLEEVIYDVMLAAANALACDVPMAISFGVGKNWAEASK